MSIGPLQLGRYVLLLAIVFCTSLSAAAGAEPPASLGKKAGLLGTWATDCAKPPSQGNWYITYEASPDGGVRALYDMGPPLGPIVTAVEKIEILSPTTIATHIRNADPKWSKFNEQVFDLVLELKDGRKVTLQSVRSDGVVIVKDALRVANGKPADVHERCLAQPTA